MGAPLARCDEAVRVVTAHLGRWNDAELVALVLYAQLARWRSRYIRLGLAGVSVPAGVVASYLLLGRRQAGAFAAHRLRYLVLAGVLARGDRGYRVTRAGMRYLSDVQSDSHA